jgi:hypothetical protein
MGLDFRTIILSDECIASDTGVDGTTFFTGSDAFTAKAVAMVERSLLIYS